MKDYYEPAEDTFLLLEQVKKHAHGKVLEIGTGSGILAIEAARHSSSVLAVDINRYALRVAKANAKIQKLKNIKFRKSDLFQNASGRFDVIIFNPPYLPQDEGIEDKAIYGGKQGYEVIERFLAEANAHLVEDGIILLLFSSLTQRRIVDQLIADNLLESQLVSSQHLFFEELYVYLIKKTDILKTLNKKVKGLRLLAKGHRGFVYSGTQGMRKIAIKIRNPESTAPARIRIEAGFLKTLNKSRIGPKLIFGDDDYLIMEYIQGKPILDCLRASSKTQIIQILRKILLQLYTLDNLGINKEEMHHPPKHIIVERGNPVLIDFERAKYSEKAHNITQFCQFLTSAHVTGILDSKRIHLDKQEVMAAARDYSKNKSGESLDKIKRLIG